MIKRLIDLVGAVCGIVIAFPLMLTMAILVRVKLGRPILFVQTRPGQDGASIPYLQISHACAMRPI